MYQKKITEVVLNVSLVMFHINITSCRWQYHIVKNILFHNLISSQIQFISLSFLFPKIRCPQYETLSNAPA